MRSADLRQSFLDFFASRDHRIVPSAPLLPSSPNLLFTNAGMNQFVPYFLGDEKAPTPRVADTQKCIRAGGKHNDLEDVGFDTYHHTFFEMLGNWSFGDYFKKEAIQWAWELLTEVWKFPPERLYATVYRPDEGDPAEYDEEAAGYWTEIFTRAGLDPRERVLTSGKKDNFWMMGETGPCGPCSEIHIDLTPLGDSKGRLVNADSPLCIEIWNLVFIQFNANEDGSLTPLAARHVDTGMGFERVAGILATTQGFTDFSTPPSNYASDLFAPIFARIGELSGKSYSATIPTQRTGLSETGQTDVCFRVIADHIRTVSCAIADGIRPGNEGRHYVIRRILRRGILYGRKLDLPTGFMADLFATVRSVLGSVFPELETQHELIRRTLLAEEETFGRTLDRGLAIFSKWADEGPVSGAQAFTLYDTYGFPFDLTQLIARERGLEIDEAAFNAEMEAQRERARAARRTEVIKVNEQSEDLAPTLFVGYDLDHQQTFTTTVLDIVRPENASHVFLVFDRTPFYGEMGGQIGDRGVVRYRDQVLAITDTKVSKAGQYLHRVDQEVPADWKGQTVLISLDLNSRNRISRHHSATHLLNWALRETLGPHIRQAGSFVGEDRLRFDFAHFEALSPDQLETIEQMVNEAIIANHEIRWYEIAYAHKPEDVIAVFGEKYGETVRVVDIGGFAKELCGGTHVRATGELGLIKIVQETAIAAGTRRIEAIAGIDAYRHLRQHDLILQSIARQLSCPANEIEKRIGQLLADQRAAQEAEKKRLQQAAQGQSRELAADASPIGPAQLVTSLVEAGDANALRQLGSQILNTLGPAGIVVLGAGNDDKAMVVAFCGQDMVSQGIRAGDLIRRLTGLIDGKGGGKPDFAMGGGSSPDKLSAALQTIREELSAKLSPTS